MRSPLSTRSRYRRGLAASAAVLLGAGMVVAGSAPAQAAAGCTVVYRVQSQWSGGFTGDIAITNSGDPVTSWRLEFDFPDAAQKVTQGWSGTYAQSGQHVTVSNAAWNGTLGTGASVSTGFNGTFGFLAATTGSNPVPAPITCAATS